MTGSLTPNRLDRQSHGPVLQFSQGLRLHGKGPGIVRARVEVILRQALAYCRTQIRSSLRRHAFQNDLVGPIDWIRLAEFGVIDLVGAQVFLQPLHGAVGISVHRVIDLHLENQVSATLEIETQMNMVL